MAQHFLLSRPAKTLNLATVFRMTDAQAEAEFRTVRWPDTSGAPVCPECGGLNAYECRWPSGSLRFGCRACRRDFSITSGTLFASHKLPLCTDLGAIAIFCNEVKGRPPWRSPVISACRTRAPLSWPTSSARPWRRR